ncbi:MAG: RAMP superfamily CRISPR-associated protein [Acholeplasmataceae bacterium]|jgi:CRISPR/Cas system CSM-associated protein Csm5 (group 7 of RAMP superfamily)
MSIKKYRLTLTTLTNLHIGSGEITQTFECLFKGNKFCFIDENKLIESLISKNLENRFIQAVNPSHSRAEVKRNLDRNLESILRGLGYSNEDLDNLVKYSVDGQALANEKIIYKPIERFVRNGNGEVFVPGSSIKGFISNVLGLSEQDNANKDMIKNDESLRLSNKLSISDSKPIVNENLWISRISYYQDIYGSKKTKSRNSLPKDGQSNYVEFIKPNVEIVFNIVVDTQYIDLTKFNEKLILYNMNYFNLYQRKFVVDSTRGSFDDLSNNDNMYDGKVFRIGKYTNFLLKTNYVLKKYNDNPDELFNLLHQEHQRLRGGLFFFARNRNKMYQKAIDEKRYPLVLKLSYHSDGFYRENGICKFKLEEIL